MLVCGEQIYTHDVFAILSYNRLAQKAFSGGKESVRFAARILLIGTLHKEREET